MSVNVREMIESGVIRYGEAFKKSMEEGHWDLSKVDYDEVARSQATLVFGQMNEPPGARLSVALSGLTVAESFRDSGSEGQSKDILFFIDNIFRFTQAGSEVSALLGRMPSAVGYQPTLATEMGQMQERITGFVAGHSGITAARYSELMLRTGELVMDVGTMLDGKKAVKEKLIDQLGGISDALDWLYREIERAE